MGLLFVHSDSRTFDQSCGRVRAQLPTHQSRYTSRTEVDLRHKAEVGHGTYKVGNAVLGSQCGIKPSRGIAPGTPPWTT